jgi:aminoglycoside 3-N-acetyltransferase I
VAENDWIKRRKLTSTNCMPYYYRQLTAADVPLLKQLLRVFGEAFEDVPTYQGAVPSDAYLRTFLDKSHVIVVVAIDGHEVVGGLVAYELEKFEQDRRELYIYDLAVSAGHRRRRIATNLIEQLKDIARTRRVYVIYVQADRGDLPAIKLYGALGRGEDVYHFDFKVDG